MRSTIENFSRQFSYDPKIENRDRLKTFSRVVVLGMGGSNLAAPLLRVRKPELRMTFWRDYGLPPILDEEKGGTLVIVNSYSGNTEEVLDGFEEALRQGISVAAISVGGKLIARAKEAGVPYIQMPDEHLQPRMALGFNTLALAALLGEDAICEELHSLTDTLKPSELEAQGRELAERLKGKIPVIYASARNKPIAYNWKIKFNETAKIPAFANVFPELNHNEMTGFDVVPATRALSEKFAFLFLTDSADPSKIQKRTEVTGKLLSDRGFDVIEVRLQSEGSPTSITHVFEKIFSSLLLADWTAYFLAEHYGVEAEQVPMVEEFKKMI